jgi:hypothetical protein
MNDDAISRQDAIETCKSGFLNMNAKSPTEIQPLIDHTFAKGWNACNRHWLIEILKLPPARAERKKGEWITVWDTNDPYTSSKARCSICGRESDRPAGNYCKWCGTDMM